MAFYRIGNGLAGEPGKGYYNITQSQFEDCCCRGLIIKSISIEILPGATPVCSIFPSRDIAFTCRPQAQTSAGAVLVASEFIQQSVYETRCPTPDDFCEKRIPPIFALRQVYDLGNSFRVEYTVEDCGIPPEDFLFIAIVEKCG
jgi:hypothetical protein